jgi:hypothetical protein
MSIQLYNVPKKKNWINSREMGLSKSVGPAEWGPQVMFAGL